MRIALWDGGAFVANYSHSSRAPALEELYNHGPHDGTLSFEIGDPNLKLESNNGLDFSLRQQNKWINAEANFFTYDIKNFVFLAPTGTDDPGSGLPIAEFLQGDSRFSGVELNLDLKASKYLHFLGGYDYVRAELKDGRSLPRIAPLRGRFGIDAHYKGFSVRPEVLLIADQNHVFENETPTQGYKTFNVTGSYIILKKHYAHTFSMNASNLGDEFYFNHISFIKDISPGMGRAVKFGYTLRFF